MSWWSLDHDRITAETSDVESRRFGRPIARVTIGDRVAWSPERADELRQALDRNEDVLILRYPSILAAGVPAVLISTDWLAIQADSLTYWQAPSRMVAVSAIPDDATPRMLRPDQVDADDLADAIAVAFDGYVNHYSANPLLDDRLANQGYVEWVTRAFEDPSNGMVLVSDGKIDAWGMWVANPEAGDLEWTMAGVTPRARGRALYGILMARAGAEAVDRRIPRLVTSTQGANVGIQRVWARAGLLPFADFTTVHLVKRGLLS